MSGAESIASHGRTKNASLLSIGSFGRLRKAIGEIIPTGITEIIHLVSTVRKVMTLGSKVDDT